MIAKLKVILDKILTVLGNIKRILTIGLTTTERVEVVVKNIDEKIPEATKAPQ